MFSNPVPAPVPAKTVPGTGYLSRIVLGPFWQFTHNGLNILIFDFWILIDLLWIVTVWLNTLNAKSGNAMLERVRLNFKELVSHVDQLFYIY